MKDIRRAYLILYAFRAVSHCIKSILHQDKAPEPTPDPAPEPEPVTISVKPVFTLYNPAIDETRPDEARGMCIFLTQLMDDHIYECKKCEADEENHRYVFCEEMCRLTKMKMKYMYPNRIVKDTEA